jgi:hypothetical protein
MLEKLKKLFKRKEDQDQAKIVFETAPVEVNKKLKGESWFHRKYGCNSWDLCGWFDENDWE